MKKKILSLFLALAMCLSLLPTAAFAADGAQDPAEPGEEILAPEQLRDPEKDPDPEQEEQQADPSVKQDEAVAAVQALMDALPGEVTADNADELQAQLMAIDAALKALSDEQLAQFLTRYEAVCEALSSLTAVQAGETHEHYLCGGDTCNEEGHEEEKNSVTFTKWPGIGNVVDGGAYYLTENLGSFTVPSGVNLTLCLNGYNITSDGVQNEDVITVEPGATFTLCDCKRGGTTGYGTIGHRRPDQYNGSGVTVENGMFNMYGGKIANNTVGYFTTNKSNGYGGGVLVFNKGIFNMIGGEITGNRAIYGGGVSVGTAYGLHDNTAEDIGGTFNMTGGEISGNFCASHGGGVYACVSSKLYFTVSGSAQITDNYTGNLFSSSPAEGTANNVYLEKYTDNKTGETIMATIKVGTLDSTASIGVTTEEVGQTVATGVSEAAAKCFTSDDSKYRLIYDSGAHTLTMATAGHSEHPVCGETGCTKHGDSFSDWQGVSKLSDISSAGNYYLTKDVEINGTWQAPNGVKLCLNGYRIIETGNFDAIKVNNGNIFTLCDCVGTGEITHTEGKTGRGVKVQGMFNLYGGAITGNKCSTGSSYGSGVYVDSGACFNMHGGSITGNENTVSHYGYGGGVYVNGSTFNMTGGSITKNTADVGGGVYYTASNSLYVSGNVNITDNKGTDGKANNVYVPSSSGTPKTVPFCIGPNVLGKNAEIGLRLADEVIATGAHSPVAYVGPQIDAKDKISAYNEGNFILDNDGGDYTFKLVETDEYPGLPTKYAVNLYNGLHEHPICGKTCTDGAHTENLTWTGVDDLSKITANEDGTTAYYYLTQDVTRTASWTAPNNVALCLNGYSIVSTPTTQYSNVITVNGTFTLTDCNGSKSVRYFTKNSTNGRWVSATKDDVDAITVNGGVIFHTSSGSTDKGMSLRSGKFYMYGGTICGNSGGVYVESGAAMTVSGNATITGNAGDLNYNVYLNGVITVGGKLGADAKIGVTTSGTNISAGNYKTVAQSADGSALTEGDLKYFESDMGYETQIRDGKVVFVNGKLHEHPICGKTCAHAGDEKHTENLLWEPLTSKNGVLYYGGSSAGIETAYKSTNYYYLRAGNYYLAEDITTDLPILISGNVNLCLNGKTLSTNKALPTDDTFIAFIAVYENRTLTLCDCDTENKGTIRTETNLSCGVNTWYPFKENTGHTGGNFTMYGGTITGAQRGVRLCVETNGGKSTFKMYGGKITGTKRGVYINDGSIFEMYGGEITGNDTKPTSKEDSTTFGGGVVVDIGATFTMHGGTISNNNAYSGGGVCLLGKSGSATTTFNMEGGTITGNTTSDGGGGGVYLGTNTAFNMSGNASVSGNTAGGSCGGGVYVPTSSSFTMSGNSTISGNTTKYGGGVYVAGGTFNMSENAAIFGNNAGRDKYAGEGGGVCVSTGTFNMTGGSITGNNVYLGSEAPEGEGGGGVYVARNATVNVSGNVQITGNWQNGTKNGDVYEKGETGSDNNLYLYAYKDDSVLKTVTIDSTTGLASTAKIGVTTRYTPTASNPIKIATGATGAQIHYARVFTPDVQGQGYTITLPEGETNLYLSAHTHDWEYSVSADNQTISAMCKDTTCTSKDGGMVTIRKPAHAVYRDGKDATATVTKNSWAADTVSEVIYKNYTGDATPLSAAPTDAGHYIASITVGDKTAWVDYEIGKATPTADDFNFTAPTDPTYNGEVKSADFTWVDGVSGMGKIGIRHYNESGEMVIPKDAGTYTVKITVAEGTNYKAAEAELTKDSWTFTILQADYTGQKSDKTIDIVKGRSTAQSGTLTAADFFPEGTELPAGAKIASVSGTGSSMGLSVMPQSDGTLKYTSGTGITATENESYTVTISTTNYRNFTVTLTFRPVDKQPQTGFKFENAAVTKTYGNADFTITATGANEYSEVTYESSDEEVATVDNTGKVTIKGAGTATITATASATDDYAQGVATYELTVNKKTLTKDDLEFAANSTFTKEYDGTTNCTTATVQINSVAKVNSGDALPEVKGAYAYDSKDVNGATKVTFTSERTESTNYILPAGLKVENAANITKRVLTVGKVDTISKMYNTLDNALDCVTGIELIGTVSGETLRFYTSAETGGDYGIYETKFDNANAGQNKTITGTVALLESSALASNYTFKVDGKESSTAPFTATGEIIPADGGSKGSVEHTQRFTDENPKTETIGWKDLLPAGQKWNYSCGYNTSTGTSAHIVCSVDSATGALSYTITGGGAGDQITFTVTAQCNNYDDFTYTVTVRLTARDPQKLEFKGVENGKVTKTYGNQPFTQTVTGEKTDVTYASSNERVATVDNDGKVTIVGAGDTTITATAAQTNDYASASASYTLTVNKLRIAVPAPGKNKLEYDGTTQTYMPDRLDTAYCTITDNTAKDVRANNAHYTATVSLNDKANTEWDIATENDTSNQMYDFWITPATAIVTALDKKITTGQSAPELTSADYTVTGLIGNDTLGGISLYYADPSDLRTAVTPDTGKAGTYAIVVTKGGTGSNNYAPTFVNGTLTIASRPSGGVVAVTYPVNVPGETERGSVSSNVKNASKGSTVTITVEPEDGFQLADLTVTDKDGNELPLTDKGDGKYTFTMPAGKVEVNATFAEKIETSPFADVSTDAYYYEAVKWAAEQGITGGVGGGLFAPDQSCTRAQIVTFLWRAAGSPEPKSMRSFSDVPEDSYYAKAVAWAVENGITVGTSATTFSPDATCTRAQGVTFLFRAAKASADGAPAFRDVAADAYYAAAVKWATDNSVTNGIGGGLFGSDNDCTRAQIVTFLWRLYAGK